MCLGVIMCCLTFEVLNQVKVFFIAHCLLMQLRIIMTPLPVLPFIRIFYLLFVFSVFSLRVCSTIFKSSCLVLLYSLSLHLYRIVCILRVF